MLICCQASFPWWSSLSSALWCLWYGTCSVIKAPTTPTRPRAPTRQIVLMRRLLLVTQPSPKPLRRARRSGLSDWLSALELCHAGMDSAGKSGGSLLAKPRLEPLMSSLFQKCMDGGLHDNAAWVWKHRVLYHLISALFMVDSRKTFKQIIENSKLWMNVFHLKSFLSVTHFILFIYSAHMVTPDRFQHNLKY